MKYFRMSYEEVVFKRSYINILLLNRSIPSFDVDNTKNDFKGIRKQKNDKIQTSKTFKEIDKPISAEDFFKGLMF